MFFIVIDSHLRSSAWEAEERRLLAATLLKLKKHTAQDYWYLWWFLCCMLRCYGEKSRYSHLTNIIIYGRGTAHCPGWQG